MINLYNHLYLFSAIIFAVYSQCIIRWRLKFHEDIPYGFYEKIKFVIVFLLDPWVISSIAATFFAGVCWILALSKFELNYAYPWMSLIFVIMMLLGVVLFGESLNITKIIGTFIVVVGLILIARG